MNYEPGSIDFSVMNNQEKVFISKIIVKLFRIFLKFFFYNIAMRVSIGNMII